MGRNNQSHLNVNFDTGTGGILYVADDLFSDNRMAADTAFDGLCDLPSDLRNILRNTSENLAFEVFHDLGPSFIPPHGARRDFFSISER